jgi:hypothetical protein
MRAIFDGNQIVILDRKKWGKYLFIYIFWGDFFSFVQYKISSHVTASLRLKKRRISIITWPKHYGTTVLLASLQPICPILHQVPTKSVRVIHKINKSRTIVTRHKVACFFFFILYQTPPTFSGFTMSKQ